MQNCFLKFSCDFVKFCRFLALWCDFDQNHAKCTIYFQNGRKRSVLCCFGPNADDLSPIRTKWLNFHTARLCLVDSEQESRFRMRGDAPAATSSKITRRCRFSAVRCALHIFGGKSIVRVGSGAKPENCSIVHTKLCISGECCVLCG